MKGYVGIFRSITDHWVWRDDKMFKRWMTILLYVNHAPVKFNAGNELHTCPAGSSFRSLEEWGRLFGTNKRNVKKFFDLLQTDVMISCKILGKGNRRKHLLTVVNWDKYQKMGTGLGTESGTESGTEKVPLTKMKNNEKMINNKEARTQKSKFIIPSIEEVKKYSAERGNKIDPEHFFDHYTANGWTQGRNKPIRDWQAAFRTWEKRENAFAKPNQSNNGGKRIPDEPVRTYSPDKMRLDRSLSNNKKWPNEPPMDFSPEKMKF
jgi:hypothetical protein